MYNMEELMAAWKEDSSIDRDNLDIASIRTANLHQKYLVMYGLIQKMLFH